MFHVGTLYQTSKVKASSGWGGEMRRGLGGEVCVDERGEIRLVDEQSRPGKRCATSQRVSLILSEAVTTGGGITAVAAQSLQLCSAAHAVPTIPLLPAATAAAPSQPEINLIKVIGLELIAAGMLLATI